MIVIYKIETSAKVPCTSEKGLLNIWVNSTDCFKYELEWSICKLTDNVYEILPTNITYKRLEKKLYYTLNYNLREFHQLNK